MVFIDERDGWDQSARWGSIVFETEVSLTSWWGSEFPNGLRGIEVAISESV